MSTFIRKHALEQGLKMKDAPGNLRLEVLPGDVRKAVSKDPSHCAFACAAKRSQKGVRKAYFFRSTAWLEYDNAIVRFLLPNSMQKEIVVFDRHSEMAPGQYQLYAPTGSQSLSAIRKRSRRRKGRHQPGNGRIKRRFLHKTTGIRRAIAS